MINSVPYLEQPCERCGKKKKLSETGKESMPNLSNSVKIEYSQVICTDSLCQREFEEKLQEKALKELAIKLKREEAKAARLRI